MQALMLSSKQTRGLKSGHLVAMVITSSICSMNKFTIALQFLIFTISSLFSTFCIQNQHLCNPLILSKNIQWKQNHRGVCCQCGGHSCTQPDICVSLMISTKRLATTATTSPRVNSRTPSLALSEAKSSNIASSRHQAMPCMHARRAGRAISRDANFQCDWVR